MHSHAFPVSVIDAADVKSRNRSAGSVVKRLLERSRFVNEVNPLNPPDGIDVSPAEGMDSLVIAGVFLKNPELKVPVVNVL